MDDLTRTLDRLLTEAERTVDQYPQPTAEQQEALRGALADFWRAVSGRFYDGTGAAGQPGRSLGELMDAFEKHRHVPEMDKEFYDALDAGDEEEPE